MNCDSPDLRLTPMRYRRILLVKHMAPKYWYRWHAAVGCVFRLGGEEASIPHGR